MKVPTVHLRKNKKRIDGTQSYYLEWYVNGDREYVSLKDVTDINEARRRQAEIIKELEDSHGYYSRPQVVSLSDAIDRHIELKERTGKEESTIKRYRRAQRNIEDLIDQEGREAYSDIKKITPARFEFLANRIYELTESKDHQGLIIGLIKAAENTMIKKGLLGKKFTFEVPVPSSPKNINARYLSMAQLKELWTQLKEPYLGICRFMANTGLRVTEVCNLRWEDIDLNTGKVAVQIHYDDDGSMVWKPKGVLSGSGGIRNVNINSAAMDVLKNLDQSTPFVFMSVRGKQLTRSPINRNLKKALKAIGVTDKEKMGSHVLRHCFGSYAAHEGWGAFKIGKYMGQSTQRVTELYMHLDEEQDKGMFEKIAI